MKSSITYYNVMWFKANSDSVLRFIDLFVMCKVFWGVTFILLFLSRVTFCEGKPHKWQVFPREPGTTLKAV